MSTSPQESRDVGPATPGADVRSLIRLAPYLRPHVRALTTMALASGGGVALAILIPMVTRSIIDGPIAHHEIEPLLPLGLLAIALGIAEALLVWIRRWAQSKAVLQVETTLRHDLYEHLQALPMSFHTRWGTGQLLTRATGDLSLIRRFSGFGLLFLVMNTLQVVITTIVLLTMYWPLGLVVAVAAVPVIWLSMRFEKSYTRISRMVQDQTGDLATLAEEGAVGIRVIKAFGRSAYVARRYQEQSDLVYGSTLTQVRLSSRFTTFLGLIPNVAVLIVLGLGAWGVSSGAITVGELVAFITLMLSLVWPVSSLGPILAMTQEAMTAAARVLEVFDTEPAIASGPRTLDDPQGHVRFEGVGFAFDDDPDTLVLDGLDLDVRQGETVAIVGATGSGKTLLTSLVPRLQDVTAGRVTIDGIDVRELDLVALRTVVATAFEDPTLFSMSVRENLTLGRSSATEEEIERAVEIAQAHFVRDLPWGLDTRIGEQGMSLSGGQRQRLALARAVLTAPKVLVLDDTLSALDAHTEMLVEEALRRALASTTALIVAHRASTVLLADRVALLEDGRITAVGEHRDLLATEPAYRELLAAYDADEGLDDLDDDLLEGAR